MQLKAWSYQCSKGFTLRGWHTPPTGKALVHFVHGNGFCGLTYSPLLKLLSEHFDLWISDLQGHGLSDAGEQFYGWNAAADLALEAFAAHGLFEAVPRYALGHSLGGVVSALMVSQAPTRFNALVMLDPVLFTHKILWFKTLLNLVGKKERLPMVQAALKRRSRWESAAAAKAALSGRGIYRGWREEALDAFIEHALKPLSTGEVELRCAPRLEADIFASSPKGLWPALKRISIASRLIYGAQTYPFVGQAAQALARCNANVSTQVTPGGHCFMQEYPEQAAKDVLSFLQAL